MSAYFERLDILVDTAGATWGAPVEAFPASGWDELVEQTGTVIPLDGDITGCG